MSSKGNIPASVRQKLLNKSKDKGRPFLEVLQYYAMERFLYRLSISAHAPKFFLKGALMFRAWGAANHRPTLDIDLLGKTTNSVENLVRISRDVCQENIAFDDGIVFLHETVRGKIIQTEAEYEGIRTEFEATLDKAVIYLQIDIGFGDIIFPAPQALAYPTILDFPAPQLLGYTIESVIAEKFETMVKRGLLNSRMKDFFDVWALSQRFSFNSHALANAIQATFNQRGTTLQPNPDCFSAAFISEPFKRAQWESFIRKLSIEQVPASLDVAIREIEAFLTPIVNGLNANNLEYVSWDPQHKIWIAFSEKSNN